MNDGSYMRHAPRDDCECHDCITAVTRTIPSMPQTSKEKQESFRARMALLGMSEVRGIYLPKDLHASIKQHALRLLETDTAQKWADAMKDKK